MALFVFHFDISGKEYKDLQPENKYLISLTLFVFHFDISIKEDKEYKNIQLENICIPF